MLVLLGDLVMVLLGMLVGRALWLEWGSGVPAAAPFVELFGFNPWMPPVGLFAGLWLSSALWERLYDPERMTSSVRILRAATRTTVLVLVVVVLWQFVSGSRAFSRPLVLGSIAASGTLLALWRVSFLRLQSVFPVPEVSLRRVAIVGVGEDARLLAERLRTYGEHLYTLRGFLTCARQEDRAVQGPILGGVDDLRNLVNAHEIEVVVLANRVMSRDEAFAMASDCARMGLEVVQVPFTWGLVSARVEPAHLGELDLVRLGQLEYPSLAEGIKRAFDLFAVIVGGGLLLPFLLLVALAIKLQDRGPVFYVSKRIGRGGRAFDFYKFRSMVVGAHLWRDSLSNESDGRLFKVRRDPRVTRLGLWLRKWSIDELPQLLNVLRGDMNLVGPRPLPMEDLEGIEGDPEHGFWFEQRSRVKPGITGPWQVAGRSNLPFEAMVELDVHYIQNWSLWLDLQILAKTLPAVVRRRGAH